MSKSVDKASSTSSFLSVQTIVLAGVGWGLLALLYYMVFGTQSDPSQELPKWYTIGTYIFEMVAFLAAALLCFRNWLSPQVVSGRGVWLSISLAMLFYFFGQAVFCYIEIGRGEDPALSPADIFFTASYVCMIWGMCLAVFSKRLSLEIWQWLIVASIGAVGIAVFVWLTFFPPQSTEGVGLIPVGRSAQVAVQTQGVNGPSADRYFSWLSEPAMAQVPSPKPAASPQSVVSPKPAAPAQAVTPGKSPAPSPATKSPQATKSPTKPAKPGSSTPVTSPASPVEPATSPKTEPETWLARAVPIFYLFSDVFLLVMATMLLLAFWGGRFSMPWRMMAAAAFSFYISDIYFKIASDSANYQSGGLLEVGWVFSGILFGLGAALEYDLSTSRSRRGGRRRG